MGPLSIAQYLVATALFMTALLHLSVWLQSRIGAKTHLLLALTVLVAGAGAGLTGGFYQATTVDAFIPVFKGAVAGALAWRLAFGWFVAVYTGLQVACRGWLLSLSALLLGLLIVNSWAPGSLLYSEITELRTVVLPWGEHITVAEGRGSTWRLPLGLADLGILVLIVLGSRRLWQQGERRRAELFGGSLVMFMLGCGSYDLLVNGGLVPPPYLFSYGFLMMAIGLSYDLIGRVVANERHWRSIPEQVQIMVASIDGSGRIDYANPHLAVVSGYTATHLTGRPLLELLPTADPTRLQKAFDRTAANAASFTEFVLRTRDGAERMTLWSSIVLHNTYGEVTDTLIIGIDLTEQRQAEAARDAAMQQLQNTLQELEAAKTRLEDHVVYLQQEIRSYHHFDEMIGQSEALKAVLNQIEQVAPSAIPVLIDGETGVGKELVARAIHRLSPRHDRPLIKVNCAALLPNLIEDELFGHEKGAFTGAIKARKGLFEIAHNSTLFLDEIGELPLELQPKLLRVLQEGELERLGGDRLIHVDVRLIVATNRNLLDEVRLHRFREDLYYRLNVYPITVPPLRHRKEDIPFLVSAMVTNFAGVLGKQITSVPQTVMAELLQYPWPGNIRELENIIKRAVLTTAGDQLQLGAALSDEVIDAAPNAPIRCQATLEQIERNYILYIMSQCDGRIEGPQGAAEQLGLNPSTLRSRLRKLGIKRTDTKDPAIVHQTMDIAQLVKR